MLNPKTITSTINRLHFETIISIIEDIQSKTVNININIVYLRVFIFLVQLNI